MTRILYEPWKPQADSREIVQQATTIIREYRAAKIVLTIRQLYYQFVQRNWLRNTERNYQRLIGIMAKARLAGLIDWDAIEDRTRNLSHTPHWDSPQDSIDAAAYWYKRDLWATQPCRVEVWIEKEALASVFETICRELRVDFMACKGYMSLSELQSAGTRMKLRRRNGQKPIVLHFGDHDPSGLDMTRNISDRLSQFAETRVLVKRLALNMDQIERYNPPPNPAKQTDSRYATYAEEFGDESWELDALEPRVLRRLVQRSVMEYCDADLWEAAEAEEREERAYLKAVAGHWEDVVVPAIDASEDVDLADYREDAPEPTDLGSDDDEDEEEGDTWHG